MSSASASATSSYYNFISAEKMAPGRLSSDESSSDLRRSPFAHSSSTSSSSLNQFSSLTPSSSNSCCSSASVSGPSALAAQLRLNSSSGPLQLARRSPSEVRAQASANVPQLTHSLTLQSLKPKPLKPFKSNGEYLEAMKEDLADWLGRLYPDLQLTAENFFSQLETGSIICRHANNVTQMGRDYLAQHQASTINQLNSSLSEPNSIQDSTTQTINTSTTHHQDHEANNKLQPINHSYNHKKLNDQFCPEYKFISKQTSRNRRSTSPSIPTSSSTIFISTSHETNLALSNTRRNYHQQSNTNNSNSLQLANINWFRIKMLQYKQDACSGTFFARDNICQFILWCRSLNILECLLFETDDLVARKNEKSFILCLLEVARIGFKVGMPTPLIIQLEQEIDKEIENDAKLRKQLEEKQGQAGKYKLEDDCCSQSDREQNDPLHCQLDKQAKIVTGSQAEMEKEHNNNNSNHNNNDDNVESECSQTNYYQGVDEDSQEKEENLGPKPQVITNDLVSLHEKISNQEAQTYKKY